MSTLSFDASPQTHYERGHGSEEPTAYLSRDRFAVKEKISPFFSTVLVFDVTHFPLILIVQNYVDVRRWTEV